ncbi:MAG TPA: TonB-dependent receptor, partial [Phenylobacterium sp.]|uniref:TonB-dependent receptor n=1 Tax=Phenylobacterium sp. TaxID=1871053 RepID=UPI002B497963
MRSLTTILLTSVAMAVAMPAMAQEAGKELEEVIVTATRQTDTVNRVALSVSAQTQRAMDQQGIRNVADLAAAVPALGISQTAPGVAFVSIRGIQNNGPGAATTGFYLDDTPLTKRGALGCCTGNGSPLPPLFDLERVEVLRGPQGTLFGSGSQGGTIRYITPQPSLTRRSIYARTEASTTADGDPSWEVGAAMGGPIIEDKLGFRVSFDRRHTGGWLDYLNRVTLEKGPQNANYGDAQMARVALTWAATENTRITAAYFNSHDKWRSRTNGYTPDTLGPITEEAGCYSNTGALISCAAPNVNYRRGPLTLPQLSGLGEDTSIDPDVSPSKTVINIGTLTVDHDFDGVAFKSISSYIQDTSSLFSPSAIGTQNRIRGTRQTYNGFTFLGQGAYAGLPNYPGWYTGGANDVSNRRYGWTQEIRFSSTGDPKPFSWVAGAFYSHQGNTQLYEQIYPDFDLLVRSLIGISALQRYGVPMFQYQGQPIGWSAKYQTMKDTELAAFGEANWWITDRLKLNGGLRVSRLTLDYFEVHYGPASGGNDPAKVPGGITGPENHTESAVAPKVSVQYQFTGNDMAYVTVSKGFRAGGVNASIPETLCGATLARYGETVLTVPKTYKSDTVWSYEAGA